MPRRTRGTVNPSNGFCGFAESTWQGRGCFCGGLRGRCSIAERAIRARRDDLRLRRQDLRAGTDRVRLVAVQQERDPVLVELERLPGSPRAARADWAGRPQ